MCGAHVSHLYCFVFGSVVAGSVAYKILNLDIYHRLCFAKKKKNFLQTKLRNILNIPEGLN